MARSYEIGQEYSLRMYYLYVAGESVSKQKSRISPSFCPSTTGRETSGPYTCISPSVSRTVPRAGGHDSPHTHRKHQEQIHIQALCLKRISSGISISQTTGISHIQSLLIFFLMGK